MKLKAYLHHINPIFSTPHGAKRLLWALATILFSGLLMGTYSFLLFTFNAEISQRRGYMSSTIAEAHTFFTTRQALLESISLSAVRDFERESASVSAEEIHLLLGSSSQHQWSLWLSERMRDYLRIKQVNLLYVNNGSDAKVSRLYNSTPTVSAFSDAVLHQLESLEHNENSELDGLWLTEQDSPSAHFYLFIRLDKRDRQSGWLGLEMNTSEVSAALSEQNTGKFMILNSDGALLFTYSLVPSLSDMILPLQARSFFGLVGSGWWPDHLVISKQLQSSDWQLVYSIELRSIMLALWPQLLGALLFCLISLSLLWLLILYLEQRFITPAIHRIQALVESELFCRDLIQTAPVALCVMRRTDGHVVLENRLSQLWLGHGPERKELSLNWIQRAFESTKHELVDFFETLDGRNLYLSSASTRYKGEDVLLCAFSDITARTQIEHSLQQARQMAEAANEAKTLFLATMSHEIRTPLHGVLGTLELLGRTQLDPQQRDFLHAIEGSSATLLQLICDVLDVSKIEAGQLALELSEISVVELTQEIVQAYTAAAQRKGLKLYACYDPSLPDSVIGDVARIRQILSNLLSNAVKFTDSGRVVVRLSVQCFEGERASVSWQISDTGRGIPKAAQPFIFEPFYQTEGSTDVVVGTGLGLPICLRLIQLMNGSIRMVSKVGLGSSFSLSLPLEFRRVSGLSEVMTDLLSETIHVLSPVRELAETVSGWLSKWGARPHIGHPPPYNGATPAVLLELHPGTLEQRLEPEWSGPVVLATGDGNREPQIIDGAWKVNLNHLKAIHQAVSKAQGMQVLKPNLFSKQKKLRKLNLNILVAEDNVINQLILRDQLEELGCTAVLSSNGEEALSIWSKGNFDLLLTDVNMPKLNGYELTRHLRSQGCVAPIIGATANAMLGEHELCLAAGMNHCLVKPFSLRALFDCLAPYERADHESM
ncbi:response regulator [Pseudomonas fragi]|uniref:ATP-binding protein n=1 Tax=Pseudomonas fragi TaxID=296 RepID=UPI001474BE07|nr:ATP-binding protein [Pseudomonas fragi]NNB06635.1 response regulator [Pseudomonas fragi]